jgi:hypothetical protein
MYVLHADAIARTITILKKHDTRVAAETHVLSNGNLESRSRSIREMINENIGRSVTVTHRHHRALSSDTTLLLYALVESGVIPDEGIYVSGFRDDGVMYGDFAKESPWDLRMPSRRHFRRYAGRICRAGTQCVNAAAFIP